MRTKEKRRGSSERVIEELVFSGRMPTNVASGQGDHTVAEGLLRRVIHKVVGQRRNDAFAVVLDLVINSSLSADKADAIVEKNQPHYQGFADKSGEDQNRLLEDLIQDYVRAANKRAYTAFPRKAAKTAGGGGERAALKQLDLLSVKYYDNYKQEVPDEHHIAEQDRQIFVANVCTLVDYAGDDIEEAVKIVQRAMVTALERVPFYVIWQSLLERVTAKLIVEDAAFRDDVTEKVAAILTKSYVEEYRAAWCIGPSVWDEGEDTDEESSSGTEH
ncbi:hypothetical protein [Actinocrispum wychmicini]|uniref:hypothetical protein n=1 Tax=Actinocrispum wychmicini TaxID=1213861 RepID=UPI00104FFE2D|nr:hypothetical protein [Actinocrispum wychmicini]